MNISLDWKTRLVCQVMCLNGFNPTWNNSSRVCMFIIFCLMPFRYHLTYHAIQYFFLCAIHWIMIMSYLCFSSLENLNIILLIFGYVWLKIKIQTNAIYSASPYYVKCLNTSAFRISASSINANVPVKENLRLIFDTLFQTLTCSTLLLLINNVHLFSYIIFGTSLYTIVISYYHSKSAKPADHLFIYNLVHLQIWYLAITWP